MTNFLRALRLTMHYRWTLGTAFFCSLMVGLLWGANIGAVYPFIEIVFRGKSLHGWVEQEIADSQTKLADFDAQIAKLKTEAKTAKEPRATALLVEIDGLETNRYAEEKALALNRWLSPYIHNWLPSSPYLTLIIVVGLLLVGTVVKDAFLMGNTILVERATGLAMMDLRAQFFGRALDIDMAGLGAGGPGELTSRFTYDMQTLSTSIRSLFGRATVEPLKMIVCLALASAICWRLLLFSLILAPPAAFLIQRLSGSIKRANRRAMEEMSRLVGQLGESMGAVQVVKAFTMEEYEQSRFQERSQQFYHKSMQITFYSSLVRPTTELLGIGVISVALLAGAYLVLGQETHMFGIRMCDRPISLASLLLFYGLLAGVSDPARKLADIYGFIQPGMPASDRIYDIIDRKPAIADPPSPRSAPSPHRQLVIENVSFSYGRGKPVLNNVSLEIRAGEAIAIVGPNGCGKTTLASLIPRFHDPVQGTVRLDHVDLREMSLFDLRSRVGLVSQHTQLFDDTVMSNIRYGSLDATDDEVIAAAKQAHAHKFIEEKLSHGYQTIVGPGGNQLSGGQRQRIALARAILRNPEILMLDEATSQVDLESEQLIHQVLEKFIRNRTTIIITHRMSTLALANRIVVMEAGRIIDIGTHDQLVRRCDLYQRLHELQFRRIA